MMAGTDIAQADAVIASSAGAADEVVRGRRIETAGLALGCLLLLVGALRVFAYAPDDAFITYRYAWNLRHGFGPVFNPGDHVEGYSSPLFTLLTSLLMGLPGDVLLRAKLLGVACALGTLWLVWRLAAELELPSWARAAAPTLLGLSAGFALNAVDGMESALQALLVTAGALLLIREQKSGRGWLSALPLLAAALNRPEAVLYFAVAVVLRALAARARGRRRHDLVWLAAFCVPYIAFLVWRHAYYGDWLPNTVYAKTMSLDAALDLNQGPAYLLRTIHPSLNQSVLLACVSGVLWLGVLAGALSERVRRNGAAIVPLLVAVQALVALRAGGDWMQGWRYMAPVFPLWTLLLLVGALEAGEAAGRGAARRAVRGATVAGLFAVFAWSATLYRPEDGMLSWARQVWATDARGLMRGTTMENTVATAEALNRALPAGATVAFTEMGAVPFYTPKLRWLDAAGLNDAEIARLPSMARTRSGVGGNYMDGDTPVGAVVLRRRPDYVMAWLPAAQPVGPILDGIYAPAFAAPLPTAVSGQRMTLRVWRRRGDP